MPAENLHRFVEAFLREGFPALRDHEMPRLEDALAAFDEVVRETRADDETRAAQLIGQAELALRLNRLATTRGALQDARELIQRQGLPELDLLLLERALHLLREEPDQAAAVGREALERVASRGVCLLPWHEWDQLATAEAPEVRRFLDRLEALMPSEAPLGQGLTPEQSDTLATLGAQLVEIEPWLQDPVHLLQIVPELTERIGRFPPEEARAWILRLRRSLALHEDLSFLPQLEGQLAWVQGALAGSAGQLKEAAEALERASTLLDEVLAQASLEPGRPATSGRVTLLQQTADCLLELDRLDEAEEYYREARRDPRAGPQDEFALGWGLGRVHFFQGRHAEAFRELRRAQKAFDWAEPRWIGASASEGSAYERLGKLRQDLEEMLEESREAMQGSEALAPGRPLRPE